MPGIRMAISVLLMDMHPVVYTRRSKGITVYLLQMRLKNAFTHMEHRKCTNGVEY